MFYSIDVHNSLQINKKDSSKAIRVFVLEVTARSIMDPDNRTGYQCDMLSERGLSWVNTDEDVGARRRSSRLPWPRSRVTRRSRSLRKNSASIPTRYARGSNNCWSMVPTFFQRQGSNEPALQQKNEKNSSRPSAIKRSSSIG